MGHIHRRRHIRPHQNARRRGRRYQAHVVNRNRRQDIAPKRDVAPNDAIRTRRILAQFALPLIKLHARNGSIRIGRICLANPRRPARKRLLPEWPQAVDHQRERSWHFCFVRHCERLSGIQRHHRIHRRKKYSWVHRRQKRRQVGYPRVIHLRVNSRRLPRTQRKCSRRSRQGIQDRDRDPQ